MANEKDKDLEINQNISSHERQSSELKRIDGSYILHEIEHVLHFEKGILYTIKELLIRPGDTVKYFIFENRNRLVKPIVFIIITSLIYSLAINFFHIEDGYVKFEGGKLATPIKIFKWIQGHYGYANIIMGIFIAFWLKLFFRKYHYNFFEILILLCFVMGIAMLIYSLFALLQGLIKIKLGAIGGIIGIGYCSWAIGQFFDKKKAASYIKALASYLLGMITFVFLAISGGTIIDYIIGNLK